MVVFVLERPAHAAPRLWVERPGVVPELVVPLTSFTRRWGGTYGWGATGPEASLTGAVLAWKCGYSSVGAAFLGPVLASELLRHFDSHTVRMEKPVLSCAISCVAEEHRGEFIAWLFDRERRRHRGK